MFVVSSIVIPMLTTCAISGGGELTPGNGTVPRKVDDVHVDRGIDYLGIYWKAPDDDAVDSVEIRWTGGAAGSAVADPTAEYLEIRELSEGTTLSIELASVSSAGITSDPVTVSATTGRVGEIKWIYDTTLTDTVERPALDDNGILYTGRPGRIEALFPSGETKWSYELTDTGTPGPVGASVSDDGYVVFTIELRARGIEGGGLLVMNSDGSFRWNLDTLSPGEYSPAISGPNNAIVFNDDNALRLVRPDGTLVRSITESFISSPIIGEFGTTFDVIISGGSEFKWLAGALQLDYSDKLNMSIVPHPAVTNTGVLYAGSFGSNILRAYDLPNETELWRKAGVGVAPVIAGDGTIYTVHVRGDAHAISPDDGFVLWTYVLGDGGAMGRSGAVANDGTIFFSRAQTIEAVNANGTHKWTSVHLNESLEEMGLVLNNDNGTAQIRSPIVIGPRGTLYFGYFTYVIAMYSDVAGPDERSPWPMFGGNYKNQGFVDTTGQE